MIMLPTRSHFLYHLQDEHGFDQSAHRNHKCPLNADVGSASETLQFCRRFEILKTDRPWPWEVLNRVQCFPPPTIR